MVNVANDKKILISFLPSLVADYKLRTAKIDKENFNSLITLMSKSIVSEQWNDIALACISFISFLM